MSIVTEQPQRATEADITTLNKGQNVASTTTQNVQASSAQAPDTMADPSSGAPLVPSRDAQLSKLPTATSSRDASPAPVETPVSIGDTVRILSSVGSYKRALYATVVGVSNADERITGADNEPYLTVVFLSSTDQKLISGAQWSTGFTRIGPIHHHSTDAAQAGREGMVWTDVLSKAGEALSLGSLDLGAAPGQLSEAEVQRKLATGAGRGPVRDPDVRWQAATATDAQLGPKDGTRSTDSANAELINHPLGSVGAPVGAVNDVTGTQVNVGKDGAALAPTGSEKGLSTPAAPVTKTVPGVIGKPNATPQDQASKLPPTPAQEIADKRAQGLKPTSGAMGGPVDAADGKGQKVVETPAGNQVTTDVPSKEAAAV